MIRITFLLLASLLTLNAATIASDPPAPAPQPATAPSDPNADSPADLATLRLLDENVKEISAENQSLEKVLNFLRDNTPVNMDVRWEALKQEGVDRNTPVSINLKHVPYRGVLAAVLSNAASDRGDPAFVVEDGIIVISFREDLQKVGHRSTRVYNVRDLLTPPPPAGAAVSATQPLNPTLAADLQKILQETAPDSKFHPTAGKLTEFNGLFIIETTAHTHRHIADLLAKLRAASTAKKIETQPAKIENDSPKN